MTPFFGEFDVGGAERDLGVVSARAKLHLLLDQGDLLLVKLSLFGSIYQCPLLYLHFTERLLLLHEDGGRPLRGDYFIRERIVSLALLLLPHQFERLGNFAAERGG